MLIESPAQFASDLPSMKRVLGLDVGDKTIGLALSDVMRSIATPMETIRRVKFSKDIEKLKAIVEEHKICGLVVGYPINMDASEGPRVQSTRAFISNTLKHIDLPVTLWDERMSTMAVQRMMTDEGDLSRKRRSELVDKLAASYMLQGYLDSIR